MINEEINEEIKMIQEAGTPALLCFEPEELPTGCRITSFINMKIRVKAKPPFLCLRHGFVQQLMLLTMKGINVSRHSPFINSNNNLAYLNLSP